MKCRFFCFGLSVLLSLLAVSQNGYDEDVFREFERNYDSLLQGHYMKMNSKLLNKSLKYTDNTFTPSQKAADLPDSVFIKRLRSIPSVVPLTFNSKVKSNIVYYIDRIGDRVGVMLGLSKYYFPIFDEILDKYGVPCELKYLVVIESALNPQAVSRAGATGLWQFMYATGRMYDLRVNSIVDDRRDPIKATEAAAKYLRDLHKIYDDWTLAIAAYNCGPGNINKAMRRSGRKTFWEIYDYLPRETRGYVPAYIAAAYVMNFHNEHGISPTKLTKPLTLISDTIMLKKDLYFGQIAEVMKIPIEQLKELNPQYKTEFLPGEQGKYSLKLPYRYINDFIALEDSISNYDKERFAGNRLQDQYSDGDVEYRDRVIYHKVRRGESWYSVAKRYGVTISQLKSWNPKSRRRQKLRIGETLAVKQKEAYKKVAPTTQDSVAVTTQKEKSLVDSDNQAIDNRQTADELKKSSDGSKPKQNVVKHKVKKGETVAKIAKRYGVSVDSICKLNNMSFKQASKIRVGQILRIK